MTPDAERRMLVYQEGQRAFNSGATCPYTDWRAGTWAKGKSAAEAYWTERQQAEAAQQVRAEIDDTQRLEWLMLNASVRIGGHYYSELSLDRSRRTHQRHCFKR